MASIKVLDFCGDFSYSFKAKTFTLCLVGYFGMLKTILQLFSLAKHECGKCISLVGQCVCLTIEQFLVQSVLFNNSKFVVS